MVRRRGRHHQHDSRFPEGGIDGNYIYSSTHLDFDCCYLIVAAVIGFVAEFLVGSRLPFGFGGAIVAALVGAWLLTKVIIINGVGDINVYGVPIVRALVGAIILVAIWQLLASALWRGGGRYSYR